MFSLPSLPGLDDPTAQADDSTLSRIVNGFSQVRSDLLAGNISDATANSFTQMILPAYQALIQQKQARKLAAEQEMLQARAKGNAYMQEDAAYDADNFHRRMTVVKGLHGDAYMYQTEPGKWAQIDMPEKPEPTDASMAGEAKLGTGLVGELDPYKSVTGPVGSYPNIQQGTYSVPKTDAEIQAELRGQVVPGEGKGGRGPDTEQVPMPQINPQLAQQQREQYRDWVKNNAFPAGGFDPTPEQKKVMGAYEKGGRVAQEELDRAMSDRQYQERGFKGNPEPPPAVVRQWQVDAYNQTRGLPPARAAHDQVQIMQQHRLAWKQMVLGEWQRQEISKRLADQEAGKEKRLQIANEAKERLVKIRGEKAIFDKEEAYAAAAKFLKNSEGLSPESPGYKAKADEFVLNKFRDAQAWMAKNSIPMEGDTGATGSAKVAPPPSASPIIEQKKAELRDLLRSSFPLPPPPAAPAPAAPSAAPSPGFGMYKNLKYDPQQRKFVEE